MSHDVACLCEECIEIAVLNAMEEMRAYEKDIEIGESSPVCVCRDLLKGHEVGCAYAQENK